MPETKIVQVAQRKICWPEPDSVCLEGGCIYCNGFGKWKNIGEVGAYAREVGIKTYHPGVTRDYVASFRWGRDWGWPNTEQRIVPKKVKV